MIAIKLHDPASGLLLPNPHRMLELRGPAVERIGGGYSLCC